MVFISFQNSGLPHINRNRNKQITWIFKCERSHTTNHHRMVNIAQLKVFFNETHSVEQMSRTLSLELHNSFLIWKGLSCLVTESIVMGSFFIHPVFLNTETQSIWNRCNVTGIMPLHTSIVGANHSKWAVKLADTSIFHCK